MIHLIVGDEAAKNLEAAMELDENLRGEIIVLKDNLANGPLVKSEDENHNTMRSNYWKKLMNQEDLEYIDENTIKLLIVRAEREEEPICFWLAPNGTDVCTYFWILPYFKSHPEMLHTINIIGLPFLNEKGQLFYPTHFAQIPAKEFIKTKRLLKEVTPAEYETEGDEWARLQEENTLVRIYDGGKKIISKPNTYFDTLIQNSLGADFQKAHKIVNEVLKKNTQFPPAAYIEWRIKEMIQENTISCKGDTTKSARDYEIKKVGSPVEIEEAVAEEV
jgi:hypothetical protein